MAMLSLSETLKLKQLVSRYGVLVHVHDACGGQSFTLEPGGNPPDQQVYEEIENFFQSTKWP